MMIFRLQGYYNFQTNVTNESNIRRRIFSQLIYYICYVDIYFCNSIVVLRCVEVLLLFFIYDVILEARASYLFSRYRVLFGTYTCM